MWPVVEQTSKGSGFSKSKNSKKHKSSHHKSSNSKLVPVESLPVLGQETTTDTFPKTDPVPVDGGPFTGLPVQPILKNRLHQLGDLVSELLILPVSQLIQPGLNTLPDNDFTVSLDEPLFGTDISPKELVSNEGGLSD